MLFTDNGKPFDSTKLSNGKGKGGQATLKYAADYFDIKYRYDTENILEIILPENLPHTVKNPNYTINLNAKDVFGQVQAEGVVLKELVKIPADCEKIIVDIWGEIFPAISCSFAVIDTLLKLKNEGQKVVVYLPENLYYIDTIIQYYSDHSDVNIKIKD